MTKKKPKVSSRPAPTPHIKICSRCGVENKLRTAACSKCGKSRFEPPWVWAHRPLNRQFSVQITSSNPNFGEVSKRITLSKWWPGGNTTFHFPNPDQWDQVKRIIDGDLAPSLKWKGQKQLANEIAQLPHVEKKARLRLTSLAKGNPALVPKLLKGIDFKKLSDGDVEIVGEFHREISEIYAQADEGLRKSIAELVKKLPAQGAKAIQELSELMESLTLHQITAVTSEVERRAGLLKTFKDRALDDRTYEIQGDGSIHRLLEQAMWIVDEHYWLMHSNSTLRTVIGKELAKADKRFENKRPDFVCGSVDNKLIVIELKRPSRTLTVADLNQLERYVVIAQEYDNRFKYFEAILVGKKSEDDLGKVLRVRGGSFRVRTFAQLIDDTERRYDDYLKHLKK